MANYFKIKHGFVSTGDGSITGTLDVSNGININGDAVATQAWVNSLGLITSGSVSSNYLSLSGGTLTGTLTLSAVNPRIDFNGTSDSSVDMAIVATPEGLDFIEPEQGNRIQFQIKDDAGVNAPYGYAWNGQSLDDRYAAAAHTHAYNTLTGIPNTFTPSAHTHPIDEIDGLQDQLDGKQPAGNYLTSLPSHNHDSRYLVKGGSWNGLDMPGSRWGGFSVNGGEVVFQRDNPNNGQMSVMVDGNFYAGERNGFWSLYGGGGTLNSYNAKVGFYSNSSGHFLISTSAVYAGGNQVWHAGNFNPSDYQPAGSYQPAGTYNTIIGTDSDINTSGSTIIDNIYVTDGVITSMGTRTLTTSDINAMPVQFNTSYAILQPEQWADYNVGNGTMLQGSSVGLPSGAGHGYWFTLGRRDVASGYAGILVNSYSTGGSGVWIGRNDLGDSSPTWEKIWTNLTDGAGSGLDADVLDGQQGSYYLDWTNTTNKPDPTLTINGDASGTATFTNLGSTTLTLTIADDSHNHTIANVDGLQTALDGKLSTGHDMTLTLSGDASGSATFTNMGNATLSVTVANDSHTHDGRYYTESESDARFVNVTGDTITGDLHISGASLGVTSTAQGTEAFYVDGVNGRLFTISDDLSDSLFSVNTISGLPVIEAFADNTVKIGPFSNPVTIDSSGVLAIGGVTAATQTYVDTAITNLIGGAPGALDTLNELAAAINDNASYASSVTTALGLKAPLASPALTGTPTAPTAATSTNSTQIATTAFVKAQGYVTTDTNYYLNGISRSGNVLTFSVAGATNQTYTFGSAAWSATSAFDAAGSADAVNTRIDEEVLPLFANYQAAGNYFTDGDTVLNMANNDGLVYNDTNNLMHVKADGINYPIIDSRGGTINGWLDIVSGGGLDMNNTNIIGVNQIEINDPGEGIIWKAGASGDIMLAVTDDASDNVLNLSGTGASLAVNGATVATQAWVNAQGFTTSTGSNYYLSGASFSTSTGVLTLTVTGASNVTVDLDGRFALGSDLNAVNDRIDNEVLPNIPTNNNQLTNGAGYITGYTETDTLATVTGRGNTTTNAITVGPLTASAAYFGSTGSSPRIRIYTEDETATLGDTFGDATSDKSYIYFDQGTSSNDPGYIMHETSNVETNEGVLHLVPSDDNSYDDYVSIHGTNDPDCVKIHTTGMIETSSSYQLVLRSGSGYVRVDDGLSVAAQINTDSHGDSSQWNTAYGWGNHASVGYLTGINSPTSGDWWNDGFVKVGTDGVMEVGKYIDFHDTDTQTSDFSYRITNTGGRLYFSGDLELDGGDLYLNDGNTRLHEAGGNALKVSTNSGYIELGPMNTSHCHIQTDRTNFYFNTELRVDGGVIGSYNEDLYLRRATDSANQIQITTNGAIFSKNIYAPDYIYHNGDTDTYIKFDTNRVRIAAGGAVKFDSNETYVTRTAPAAPVFTAANIVGETIEVVFDQSPTSGVDSYQVWSSAAGGSYGLVANIPTQDIAATMTAIDAAFSVSGTHAYRVYAIKNGIYSDPAEGSVTFNASALDVVNMSVVNLNSAYYIQYDMPSSRFVDHVEIYMDAEVNSANLTRTGATLIYSGNNTSYMYQIGASDLDKFHQFWVEVVES